MQADRLDPPAINHQLRRDLASISRQSGPNPVFLPL
jgi:hypothetical protein